MEAVNEFKCRTWRYGPNGEAQIFTDSREVPKGWLDHPAKFLNPYFPHEGPPRDADGLRTDGPTRAEYIAAGYTGHYPPAGYASKEPLPAQEETPQNGSESTQNLPVQDDAPPVVSDDESDALPITRAEIIAQLKERNIAVRVTAKTAVLYTLLLSAVERENEDEDLSDEGQAGLNE